ncbi:ABC transporter substrate-binding protein [Ahrensia sp. R2A130]|uniref:ABC transporter substrate-binding protein n=1 Tax=Ahrensia sp. R2A130 TaxID=744979 RepID=UPI0001E0A4E1|nr:ABC transporter substrate-binding protein [Ahrensia sp. R2A130]EFL88238.1 putative periplasmic binding protein [Ahrensia sp. R2A130]
MRNMKNIFIQDQARKLETGGISRRQFITSMLAAGVVLPTAISMAGDVLAATPNKGGLFRHATGYGGTNDTIDPSTSNNGFSQNVIYSRGNHLTEIGPDGTLRGELAESFEPMDGATKWVFNLRKDVTFHNGKTLTADDVIASFNIHRGDDTKSAAKGLVTAVTDIKKDGDNRVIFELSGGSADFPYIASDYHLMIMASKDGKVDVTAMDNGSGGYLLKNYEAGVRADSEKNPNYWKADSAHFDALQLLAVVDPTARQQALLNGDADYADSISPSTVDLLGRVPTVDILETNGTQHYTFPMRLDVEPFGNHHLRMALKMAIDRQELVDKILLGHGVAGNDIPVNPSMPFFDASIPQRTFDPEKAAEHYKKSGHSGPIQLSVADAAFAGAVDAGQLIAASAKKAGIDIQVVREPNDGYWSNVWNKKGWCACYWGGRPTQDWMYSSAYTADNQWNDTAWRDTESAKRFNEVVVQARAETDDAARGAQYSEAQQLLHDDGGAIVAMWANFIHAHTKKLAHGDNVAANWENDGNKVGERWWFNA